MTDEIVGRRGELVALAEFLEVLPVGGSALLLEGDAGIGKTALWQEGSRLASERGARVLTARATQSELHTSFATVADLFAPVLDATLPLLVPVQRHALEVAFLLREPDGPPPQERLLAAALLSTVRILAEDRPLLVAIDDVQWVDTSSAEILRFVLRRLEADPVGVLATVRGRPVEAPFELDRAFAEFQRLPVTPLSVGAIHRLLWGRLSLNLTRPTLVRVHEAVGGNAFYALEVGRALANGTISADGAHVLLPESLRALVAERVSSLPARVRETLVAVAALGSPSVPLLEPLAPATVDDIELACRRRVLELDGDRIRFTHPLLAPVCYEDMPLHRRRGLHRRLADLNLDPEERARHLALAADGPDEEIAAALDAAASHARGRGAVQAAAELADRAVALTPPDAIDRINRRRIAAAEHCFYAGDGKKATALLEETVGSAKPGPLRADALCALAVVITATDGKRAAADLYERALAEPGLEIRQRAHVLCELACLAAVRGENEASTRLAEAGLALAEQLGDPEVLVVSLVTVAEITFWRAGRIRRDLLERAMEIERAARSTRPVGARTRISLAVDGAPLTTLAWQLGRSGRYEEARALWRRQIAEAYERADPDVGACLFFLARMEVASGEWDEAARLCDEATAVGRETGREMTEPLCQMVLAEIAALRGETERARREIPELVRAAEKANYSGAILRLDRAVALLELACGDAEASRRRVAPHVAGLEELDDYHAHLAGSVAIEAMVAVGDLATADRLLKLLDAHVSGADTALRPLADRCRGLLQAAQGDRESAIASLQAAAANPEPPLGVNPFELGRTLLALGTVQRVAQHKRAARESLGRAVEIFDQLGARLWLENARSELGRIGGRIPTEGALSETERRIVELVVAGRRNREVADELTLSPNTVAWNLSKVYRKLGVSSRTELAAHVAATPPA
jgi:ATP/maltotriose-dependent transcriptional regulator MalT